MIHLVISVADGNKWRTACNKKLYMYDKINEDKIVWNLGTFVHYERSGALMCKDCSEVPEVQIELLKRVKL